MRAPSRATLIDFLGHAHTAQASLYKAATAVRDGETFEHNAPALVQLLRTGGELPPDPTKTLRLRRVKSTTIKRPFYHLVADLSDGTATEELSLKKACRAALLGPRCQ
jgi:hypothetical protein